LQACSGKTGEISFKLIQFYNYIASTVGGATLQNKNRNQTTAHESNQKKTWTFVHLLKLFLANVPFLDFITKKNICNKNRGVT
jgi:hypothetical protein